MTSDTDPATRRPSAGYYFTFAAVMLGMVCLAIAIEGTRRALHGGEPLGAFNTAGVPALILAWALAFYLRLAFSPRVSGVAQARVRGSLRVLVAIEVAVAVAGGWYVWTSGVASSAVTAFMLAGAVAQIGGIVWLVRYSRE